MPGYGMLSATEGRGLLPWSWAEDRLRTSHDYWLATVRPDGRRHVMPLWGVWLDDALWFSTSTRSRKARNLAANERCVLTTDNAIEPVVVVEGTADVVTDQVRLRRFLDALNEKYQSKTELEFLDPEVNACYRVAPIVVFALDDADFSGSPTRWRVEEGPARASNVAARREPHAGETP